jgi:hypothetical protein
VAGPKRERTLYGIASSFFAGVVILFALAGMAAAAFGDEGVGSAGFVICVVFLLLGLGRLYLGLWRSDEGTEEEPKPATSRPEDKPRGPRRAERQPRRRRP